MFLPLIVSLLFAFVSADEVIESTTEVKETKTVEEFDQTCPVTGYTVKGMTWSTNREGRTVIKGCISPSGQKIEIGMTYVDGRAEFQCLQKGDLIILAPVACVFKGEIYPVGSTFGYKSFFYQCTQYPDYSIAVDAIGCVDRVGKFVGIGEEFRQGNFIFLCAEQDGKISTIGVKCYVPSLDKAFGVGDRYQLDAYYYECQRRGTYSLRTDVVGCASPNGDFVDVGGRFTNGRAVMECQSDEEGSLTHTVVGCYAKDHRNGLLAQFSFGDRFFESYTETLGFVMQCAFENGSIRHKAVECIYSAPDAEYHLGINCGAMVGSKIFVCKQLQQKKALAQMITKPKGVEYEEFLAKYQVEQCDSTLKIVEYIEIYPESS